MSDLLAIGRIVGTHGLHGELRIESLSDVPERWNTEAGLQELFIGTSPETAVRVHVQSVRVAPKSSVVLLLEEYQEQSTSERLRGLLLFVPEENGLSLPEDRFFIHDLIGMKIIDAAAQVRGTVADVLSYPANDVLVVDGPDGRYLLPFISDAVERIEKESGTIVMKPLDGLFDTPQAIRNDAHAHRRRNRIS